MIDQFYLSNFLQSKNIKNYWRTKKNNVKSTTLKSYLLYVSGIPTIPLMKLLPIISSPSLCFPARKKKNNCENCRGWERVFLTDIVFYFNTLHDMEVKLRSKCIKWWIKYHSKGENAVYHIYQNQWLGCLFTLFSTYSTSWNRKLCQFNIFYWF